MDKLEFKDLIGEVTGAVPNSGGGMGTGSDANDNECGSSNSPEESPQQSIQRHIYGLIHAVQCTDDNCQQLSCTKMKKVVKHTKTCKRKANPNQTTTPDCLVCKSLIALCCYHAKHCEENKCPVPYCIRIKHKLRENDFQEQLEQSQVIKRPTVSMASMSEQTSKPLTTPQHLFSSSPKFNSELADKNLRGEVENGDDCVTDQISDMLANLELVGHELDKVCDLLAKVELMPNEEDRDVCGVSGGIDTESDLKGETEFRGFLSTSHHTKHCKKNKCAVPYCVNIKHKSREQQRVLLTQQPNIESQQIQLIQQSENLFQQNPQQMDSIPKQVHLSTNLSQKMSAEQHSEQPQNILPQVISGNVSPKQQINVENVEQQIQNSSESNPTNNQDISTPEQVVQQLLAVLRSPASPQQQQQVLSILKSNPALMAAFIRHRHKQQQMRTQSNNHLTERNGRKE